jgi:hypothetical protein
MTHSTGLVLPIQPENVLSETSAGKEWKITSAEYGNDEVQKDDGGSKVEEVLSGKLRLDHTLGVSIAISILSGEWALGGFIDLVEGRDEYGSGRLGEPSLCRVRDHGHSMALRLVRNMRSAATIG